LNNALSYNLSERIQEEFQGLSQRHSRLLVTLSEIDFQIKNKTMADLGLDICEEKSMEIIDRAVIDAKKAEAQKAKAEFENEIDTQWKRK
jgi:hypothetical protein